MTDRFRPDPKKLWRIFYHEPENKLGGSPVLRNVVGRLETFEDGYYVTPVFPAPPANADPPLFVPFRSFVKLVEYVAE